MPTGINLCVRPVSHTPDRADQHRLLRIILNLLAQPLDINRDQRIIVDILPRRIPDFLQQFIPCQNEFPYY